MKLNKYIAAGIIALMGVGAVSCTGDLNMKPNDPDTQTGIQSKAELDGFLARLYGNFYRDDIVSTSDGGAGSFTRAHFNLEEITADECFISEKWNDPGYQPLNKNQWTSDNEWIYAAFAREFFNAKMGAEYIANMQVLGPKFYPAETENTDPDYVPEYKARIAEASAIRAMAYYWMINFFGKGPWITPESVTGEIPPTYGRTELFNAIVDELKAAIPDLKWAKDQSYGRVSREAGYALLARFYLNAGVFTGTPMWAECAEACKAVVNSPSGIKLAPEYKYLFCASNDKYVGNGEILWAVPQQQGRMEAWGGTTYLTAGAWVETASEDFLKTLNWKEAWGGLRVRPELSRALKGDPRRLIYEGTFQEAIPDLKNYDANSCGYMIVKYTNTTEDDYYNEVGASKVPYVGNNSSPMCNADYPMIRLADVYLMLAECQLRGVNCDGLRYLNMVRDRVGLEPLADLTEANVLHERQCELYLEGNRRTDLIRFGLYTGSNYLWSWKNGVYEGGSIEPYRALYPIPYQYVTTVPQNPGY